MRNRCSIVTLLALLALSAMPAVAQQPAAANAARAPASAASAAAAASAPDATPPPPVNRWVDLHGNVHYSDTLPRKVPAQVIESTQSSDVTPEDQARAAAQLEKDRAYLAQPPDEAAAATSQQPSSPPPAPQNNAGPDNGEAVDGGFPAYPYNWGWGHDIGRSLRQNHAQGQAANNPQDPQPIHFPSTNSQGPEPIHFPATNSQGPLPIHFSPPAGTPNMGPTR
jgi:hypothetical protein